MDGGNGQMGTLGFESILISGPGQREFLAFGGYPIGRLLVGVSLNPRGWLCRTSWAHPELR